MFGYEKVAMNFRQSRTRIIWLNVVFDDWRRSTCPNHIKGGRIQRQFHHKRGCNYNNVPEIVLRKIKRGIIKKK